MTWVKVCGMTSADECALAIDAGADALGFVVDVSVSSPREIPAEEARRLIDDVPSAVTTVLVTMMSEPTRLIELARAIPTDAIQVHGPRRLAAVEEVADSIAQAMIVGVSCEDPDIDEQAGVADAVLIDTPGRHGRGGTGRTHDWTTTASLVDSLDVPVIVAGGLTPGNVASAIREINPAGVDVATGVEAAPGVIDPDLVRAFIDRVGESNTADGSPPALGQRTNVSMGSR